MNSIGLSDLSALRKELSGGLGSRKGASERIDFLDGDGRHGGCADVIEHGDEPCNGGLEITFAQGRWRELGTCIFLPEHLVKNVRGLNRSLPRLAFKGKVDDLILLADGWELEKVAGDDELGSIINTSRVRYQGGG